jgi:hypothetical protein
VGAIRGDAVGGTSVGAVDAQDVQANAHTNESQIAALVIQAAIASHEQRDWSLRKYLSYKYVDRE